jgi:hypothetical protein
MPEYISLEVAVFEDERFSGYSMGINGFSTKMDGYLSGVFNLARVHGEMEHAPGKPCSFYNPERFRNLVELRAVHPDLAYQIESMPGVKTLQVRDISVYEAELLDPSVLSVLDRRCPYTVKKKASEEQPHPQGASLVTHVNDLDPERIEAEWPEL